MDSFLCPYSGYKKLMSGMCTALSRIWTVNISDGSFLLSIFQTSTFDIWNIGSFDWPYPRNYLGIDVRNFATFYCPLSGHQILIARIRTGNFVPISDNTVHIADFIVQVPDIIFRIPDISVLISGINFFTNWCPEYVQWKLSIFRTSNIGVQNMSNRNCSYSGHQSSMSGIWPMKTNHIPKIKCWCPEYGQFSLALSWTSTGSYSGNCARAG